ncbi:DUF6124 family protein [Pseudomonas sp. DSP3-2-2]|uniref:DUF6124 family protein n=1 Tax=unclassified Pseudomonas TaxID=196821 RepID=UPI003CEB34F4
MIRSTPHPPQTPITPDPLTNTNLGNLSVFAVRPDIKVKDALVLASEYLCCAAATAYETADNITLEFRPLARSVLHQIEAARALVTLPLKNVSLARCLNSRKDTT